MATIDAAGVIAAVDATWELSGLPMTEVFARVCDNFGVPFDSNDITTRVSAVSKSYDKQYSQIMAVKLHLMKSGRFNDDWNLRFGRLTRKLHYCKNLMLMAWKVGMFTVDGIPDDVIDANVGDEVRCTMFNDQMTKKPNRTEELLKFIYSRLHVMGYRKYMDMCYEPVYTDDGKYTYAWKSKCSIKEFIYDSVRKESNLTEWGYLVNSDGSSLAEKIRNLQDCQFPSIQKDRHVFAFRNGLYISKVKRIDGTYTDRFCSYDEHASIAELMPSADSIACKYFDHDMTHAGVDDWYSIPTPNLQRILSYQYGKKKDCEEICRTMYIMLGRLLYNVNELEGWQVIPFIKGLAGSGKGMIIRVVENFYEKVDVGTIADNTDQTFGLVDLFDKFLFTAPEITEKFSMNQAAFQSAVSGEMVSIRAMYNHARGEVWLSPGILAANQTPFSDNAGSLARRMVVFAFRNKVRKDDCDPMLSHKLDAEVANILCKCNKAYQQAVNEFGDKNFWSHVPKYFVKNQQMLSEQTNSLHNFLGSGKLRFGKKFYCPKQVFLSLLHRHCQDIGLPRCKFTPEAYEGPFGEMNAKHNIDVRIRNNERREYPPGSGSMQTGCFISGIDRMAEIDVPMAGDAFT